MIRPRFAIALLTLIAPILATLMSVAPANADAASGTCTSGYRLGSYETSKSAYNWQGRKMYTITLRKRWCYSVKSHAVGTVYTPSPAIKIYDEFTMAWKGKVLDHDAHFTSVGPDGRRHPDHPKWGHVSWSLVRVCHTIYGIGCTQSDEYKIGIIGYWDGSKKLVN